MPIPAPTQLSICNEALDAIRGGSIADINERSLAAEKCRIHFPRVVSNMLEMHDWSFANRRVQLATVTNDRPFEWLYAYAVPANCGQPINVLPDLASAGIAIPLPLPGQPYAETWATLNAYALPYEIWNSIIYTNAATAWLDYTINSIDGVLISSTCADAMADDLASRIAIPLKSDPAAKKDMISSAALKWQIAVAEDRNRQPQSYGDYISETEIARHSGAISTLIGQP